MAQWFTPWHRASGSDSSPARLSLPVWDGSRFSGFRLSLSGPALASLHSITRYYNTMFLKSVGTRVCHLSSQLIICEPCTPTPPPDGAREPSVASVRTAEAFSGQERVAERIAKKSTKHVPESLTASPPDASDSLKLFLSLPHRGS